MVNAGIENFSSAVTVTLTEAKAMPKGTVKQKKSERKPSDL